LPPDTANKANVIVFRKTSSRDQKGNGEIAAAKKLHEENQPGHGVEFHGGLAEGLVEVPGHRPNRQQLLKDLTKHLANIRIWICGQGAKKRARRSQRGVSQGLARRPVIGLPCRCDGFALLGVDTSRALAPGQAMLVMRSAFRTSRARGLTRFIMPSTGVPLP
jgi:hypothetical protein